MAIIGSAYVDIRAITDSLEANIKKALATLPDEITVPVHFDTTPAEEQLDLLVDWASLHKVDLNVDANTVAAQAHVEAVVKEMDTKDVSINVDADVVGAEAHMDEFVAAESHHSIDVPVDVDEVVAITKMAALRAKLDAIAALKPITIPVAVGNGKGPIGEIENALRATSAELEKANMKLTMFGTAMQAAGGHAKTSASNVGEFLLKLSGLQGLTDLTQGLIKLKINLGEEVPLIALTAEKIGAMATGASYAVGNILSLAGGLAQLGGVAVALPGVFTGFAIGMGLTTVAFGDMKKAVPDLAAQFQGLKDMISRNFWEEARSGLMNLVGPTSVLREELASTSRTLGNFWGTMFDGMSKGSFATAMAGDFDNLRKSIDITTGGSSVFLHIIQTLGEVGSAQLPKLADYFLSISTQFDGFLTKANADGSLARWIHNGADAAQNLIGILVNTGGVLSGLMDAAEKAGGTSLHTLNAALEHLREIILTPAVQTALVNIFSGANDAMKEAATGLEAFLKGVGFLSPALKVVEQDVGRAIEVVLTFFGSILTNPNLFNGIQDLFGGIVLGLDHFVTALNPIGDKIGIFFTLVGTIADALGGVFANAITSVLPLVSNLLTDLIPLVKPLTDITNAIITAVAPALGILAQTVFPPLINLLTGALLPALADIVPVLGAALPPAAAALGKAVGELAPVIGDLVQKLAPLVEKILEVALKAIPPLLDAIVPLVGAIAGIAEFLIPVISGIADFVGGLLSIKPVAEALTDIIFGIVAAIGIYNAVAGIAAIVTTLLDAPFLLIGIGIALLIAGIIALVEHWDDVTKAIGDFVGSTMSMFGDFNKNTQGMFDDFFANTGGMFTDFFNNTVGMVRDFVNNTVGMFTDFFTSVGQGVSTFNSNTNGMFTDFFNNTVGMFRDFFNNTVGMVTDFVNSTVGMFTDFVNNTIGMFNDFGAKFSQAWTTFWHDPIGIVHHFVDDVINNIKDFGMNLIINIAKAFEDTKNTITRWAVDAYINVTKFFVDVINGFQNWRNDVINTVIRWAVDVAAQIVHFKDDAIHHIIDFTISTVGMFKDFFNNTVGMFVDFFTKNLPDTVNTFVANTTGMIRDFNANTNGMFMDFFNNTIGMFVDFFTKNIPDTVNTFVTNTTGMINDFNANTNGMFMDFFNNTIGMFVDFFNNTVGMFVDWVNNSVSTVNGWVGGLIGMFVGFYAQTTGETRAFLDGFISAVGGFVNNTIGMFQDFVGNTVGMFQDMWNNAVNAFNDGINRVVGFVQGLGDQIMGAIGDPGSLLANAGNAIMDGFLGGLRAGFQGVQDMVGGIGQWIADHKGPEEYDRALLIPHGGWIMGGLEKGIQGSLPSLQKTLSSVTDLVSDTMNAGISVNVGAGLNTPAVNSNPNIFARSMQEQSDPFAAASGIQQGRYPAGSVITPTVNVYPSAPLNEQQVGQMAATELFWQFTNR